MMKNDEVTASNDTLFEQAPYTAKSYLLSAIEDIDAALGAGHAKKNPELVAAYIMACTADLNTSMSTRAIERVGKTLDRQADALSSIASNLLFTGGS